MSNPARPPSGPLTAKQAELMEIPQAYLNLVDEKKFHDAQQELKTSENFLTRLASKGALDMKFENNVMVPLKLCNNKQMLQFAGNFAPGMADSGRVTMRRRAGCAMECVREAYLAAPDDASRQAVFGTKARLGKAMESKIMVNGGTENCVGRLSQAYPKLGSEVERPPTKEEVAEALRSCGLSLEGAPASVLKPFAMYRQDTDPEDMKTIWANPKAECGFPVLAKWSDEGTPEKVWGILKGVVPRLQAAYQHDKQAGVWNFIRTLEAEEPWLTAVRGKCKTDCYSQEKIESFRLRFYNAFPKHFVLVMQQATQVLEEQARSVIDTPSGHSAQGVALVRGGADALITAMDEQLRLDGFAYIHVGDDTFCAVRLPGRVVLFSLDCSNFDLTQHAQATLPIHEAIRDQLSLVDPVAAQVWYAFARERVVVTHKRATLRWYHAGPSGLPCQSKVNDMLMDVVCQRIRGEVSSFAREDLDVALQRIGADLHLSIRLEDYEVVDGVNTIRQALALTSFLFIGYYFYARENAVFVFADLPRQLAQMPYPSLKWTPDKGEHTVSDIIRLGSILMNMGSPPGELYASFYAMKAYVKTALLGLLKQGKDVVDTKLIWAVNNAFAGELVEPSVSGLLAALDRMDQIWEVTQVEPPLAGTSEFLSGNWADMVEKDEKEEIKMLNFKPVENRPRAAAVQRLKALRVAARPVPTHPVTLANIGRTTPTAVWGPDKPKVDRGDAGMREKRSARYERNAGQYSELFAHSEDSLYDDFEDDYQSIQEEDYSYE